MHDLPSEFCLALGSESTPLFLKDTVPSNGLQLPPATIVRLLQALTEES